jgi:hypothetical protein
LRFQTQEKFANIWLVLTIYTDMPFGFCYLTLYAKTSREIIPMAQIFYGGLSQKSSALSILFEGGETLAVL